MCPASEHTDCIRGYIGSNSPPLPLLPPSATVTATATKEEEEVAGGGCLWTAHYVPHYARTQAALSARARPGNLVRHSSRRRFFPLRLRRSRVSPASLPPLRALSICLVPHKEMR